MDSKEFLERVDYNVKMENAVIACLMANPNLLLETTLREFHFNSIPNRAAFKALWAMKEDFEAGRIKELSADIQVIETYAEKVRVKPDLNSELLADLVQLARDNIAVSMESFDVYEQQVESVSSRQRIVRVSERISELALNTQMPVDEVMRVSEGLLTNLTDRVVRETQPVNLFDDIPADVDQYVQAYNKDGNFGVCTGFTQVDEILGPMLPGSLNIIGARAKTGKSMFGMNVAVNVIEMYKNTVPILYIDTEMTPQEQRLRMMAMISGMDARKIMRGDLNPAEQMKLKQIREDHTAMRMYHVYLPTWKPEDLVTIARRWKRNHQIGLIIFDYIKLPDDSDFSSSAEWQQLGYLTSILKNKIAGKLEVPVLSFAQLNRKGATQAAQGIADEDSVGGSDRIIHYATNYLVFQKVSEKERTKTTADVQEFGEALDRRLFFIATRHGGDDQPPVLFNMNKQTGRFTELDQDYANKEQGQGRDQSSIANSAKQYTRNPRPVGIAESG